jgi:uncharacterized protein
MNGLIQFQIPVKGLKEGLHQYNFDIDDRFFDEFEQSYVQSGQVKVRLNFDKSPDMFVLDFMINGTINTDCDRCLAQIDLPIESNHQLLIKLSQDQNLDDPDIVFVDPEISKLNIAEYIYDYIILSIPLKRVYACSDDKNPPCNFQMLEFYKKASNVSDSLQNPFQEALKNWSDNN